MTKKNPNPAIRPDKSGTAKGKAASRGGSAPVSPVRVKKARKASSGYAVRHDDVGPVVLRDPSPQAEVPRRAASRPASYSGTITTSGTSEAIRFDKALFKSHPEFEQKARVKARVIAHGMLLVFVESEQLEDSAEEDPMLAAFLSFIAEDSQRHPERLLPIQAQEVDKAVALVKDVEVSDTEPLPEDVTF